MRFCNFLILFCLISSLYSCLPKQQVLVNPNSSSKSSPDLILPNKAGTSSLGWEYIGNFQLVAIEEMKKHGIPASIKMAQALIESGNGNSQLARNSNNHFGIKCANTWTGKTAYHDDDEAGECFRVYNNPEESYRDHSAFLLRPRYAKLFELKPQDYKGWARGLKEAGYATNPRYADLLIDIIERYELYRLDQGVILQSASSQIKSTRALTPPANQNPPEPIKTPVTQGVSNSSSNTTSSTSKSTEIQTRSNNEILTHQVSSGETLAQIAEKYKVTLEEIMAWNRLKKQDLMEGQLLIISK